MLLSRGLHSCGLIYVGAHIRGGLYAWGPIFTILWYISLKFEDLLISLD